MKGVSDMKKEVSIWEKSNLTLEEASAYFGIGINKLRDMTNDRNCKYVMGFSIALIIIVLIVLYSLARTAGESDRTMEQIREQSLLGREESSGGNS